MSYDLCEYNYRRPGMRRQSQALRFAIKQAINAKLVSHANKPQRSLSRRTLRNSDVASKSKDFFVKMDSKFHPAMAAIMSGDIDELRSLLRDDPTLATARSSCSHPTLLHGLSIDAINVPNKVEMAKALID